MFESEARSSERVSRKIWTRPQLKPLSIMMWIWFVALAALLVVLLVRTQGRFERENGSLAMKHVAELEEKVERLTARVENLEAIAADDDVGVSSAGGKRIGASGRPQDEKSLSSLRSEGPHH